MCGPQKIFSPLRLLSLFAAIILDVVVRVPSHVRNPTVVALVSSAVIGIGFILRLAQAQLQPEKCSYNRNPDVAEDSDYIRRTTEFWKTR